MFDANDSPTPEPNDNLLPAKHPSMADLIDMVLADEELTEARRGNVASSIRRFCAALGYEPGKAPARFAFFRDRLQKFHPRQAGIKDKRWATIKSDVGFALKRYVVEETPARPRRPFSPEWQAVKETARTNGIKWDLQRFARFCDENGIAPPGGG